ncbi:RluA family pseudouridine synthase [Desulfosarcina ovata]|uniref:Pseudouridine synthase RsuA/RluA-like domain-containing protein n=2 Tax=Desulfosarcina ovata TaxID=83564 RepID=A0A5K8ADP9_9BACT|nr:RNA pseudouridine synthase [Desulfosarcina ovata]BBO84156.1 hypothetical protein DSCO28_47220 [Desulfosarcina ovata subsp. sediminis]BBO90666.1 hypothetical protein DSCOOX_38460 [Desulfosarcina ovata subsp. ovata]
MAVHKKRFDAARPNIMQTQSSTPVVIGGVDVPLPVVGCGPRWLVVEKPCGMSIHNDPGQDLCSLVHMAVKAGQVPVVDRNMPGVHAVHRLDRDTSGIVLLAGDSQTGAFFGAQFAARSVHKRYLAMVHGMLPTDAGWRTWHWPLTDAAGGRKNPVGRGKRKPCTTRWRALETSDHYSLVECELLSGRKHQIRRHACLAGHAVVGDRRYGSVRSLEFVSRQCHFSRMALHAHTLSFRLPGETGMKTFASGGLPDAMQHLLATDRKEH